MNTAKFTPEEINALLDQLNTHPGSRLQYIGARYVPIFGRKGESSIEWDNTGTYEPLTIVLHEGNSYTSRQYVPVGVDIHNEDFWANTGNYNAQIEALRQDVTRFNDKIAREAKNRENADTVLQNNINAEATSRENADTALQNNINAEATSRENADAVLQNNINAEATSRENADAEIENKIKKLQLLSDKNYEIVERFIVGSSVNTEPPYYGYGSPQGACTFGVNGVDYYLCATNPDNNNHVLIFNLKTHDVVYQGQYALGHANGCSYNGNNLVLFANNIDKSIVLIDVSNPANPTYQTVKTPGDEVFSSACFIGDSGKVALIHGQLDGYNFNITGADIYSDYTLSNFEKNISFNYDSNYYKGWQSVTCDGEYFYISHSSPETVVMIDMSGNVQGYIEVPKIVGHVHVDEIESAWIDGEYFYISLYEILNNTLEPKRTDSTLMHSCSLIRANFKKGNKVMREYEYSISGRDFNSEIYDPFTTFASDSNMFHKRMIDPVRYGYLFTDDIRASYHAANYKEQLVISVKENYTLNTYMSGNTTIVLNGNGIAAIWCLNGSTTTFYGTGRILDYFPRNDALKYSIICPYSKLYIPDTLSFPDGNTYDVQLNGSILVSNKSAGSFKIQKVNGSFASPGL